MRLDRSKPRWLALHLWLQLARQRVADGSAMAKAIDYRMNHWVRLSRLLQDGAVPINHHPIENPIRPWALGQRSGLFIGSPLAGERAAAMTRLLQSAKRKGHGPWVCLKDVLTKLPCQDPTDRLPAS